MHIELGNILCKCMHASHEWDEVPNDSAPHHYLQELDRRWARRNVRCVRFVGKGADDCAEDHGGAKASNEEAANVTPVKAVVLVQCIYIWPLQPVTRCKQAEQTCQRRAVTVNAQGTRTLCASH